MMKKMRLSDVPFGKNFEIWGHAYTVLDGDDKGVFVLEADAVCKMPFREENVEAESTPNNFWDSSVRAYLEGDYLEELVEAGAELDRDILEMELDLKCTLGQHEYGVARVHAGLLTLEQYGKYYDIIPRIDTTYWLATPWRTPSRSPLTGNTLGVWSVSSNGGYSSWGYSFSIGVRPALTLSPALLVSVECDEVNEWIIDRSRELFEKIGEWYSALSESEQRKLDKAIEDYLRAAKRRKHNDPRNSHNPRSGSGMGEGIRRNPHRHDRRADEKPARRLARDH